MSKHDRLAEAFVAAVFVFALLLAVLLALTALGVQPWTRDAYDIPALLVWAGIGAFCLAVMAASIAAGVWLA